MSAEAATTVLRSVLHRSLNKDYRYHLAMSIGKRAPLFGLLRRKQADRPVQPMPSLRPVYMLKYNRYLLRRFAFTVGLR